MMIKDIFFLILHETYVVTPHLKPLKDNLDPSCGPFLRDSSDKGSQPMVQMRNKKNYHQLLPLIYLSRALSLISLHILLLRLLDRWVEFQG